MYTQNGPSASQRGQYSGECWSVVKKRERKEKEKKSREEEEGIGFPCMEISAEETADFSPDSVLSVSVLVHFPFARTATVFPFII